MTKYHINPETGNPNKCVAKPGNCRFGADTNHYGSKDEARAAYEFQMREKASQALRRKQQTEAESEDEVTPAVELKPKPERKKPVEVEPAPEFELRSRVDHDFRAGYLTEYTAAIAKANKRLERYGIKERFEYEITRYTKEVSRTGGIPLLEERISLKLNAPSISVEGNTFLAVITQEENGFVTKSGRDVELNGWRPDSMKCEHCGVNRPRSKTYLIEGPDGKRHQIGSTCVDAYLGVKVQGLWAIGEDPLAGIDTGSDRPPHPSTLSRDTKHMIAYALAVSNNGENFVSRAASGYIPSTADEIERALWSNKKEDRDWQEEMERRANEYIANGRAEEVLKEIRSTEGTNDYVTNLRTIASGETVRPTNASLLVSGLSVYRRKQEKAKKDALPPAAAGFAGNPKDKIAGNKAVVTSVRNIEGTDFVTGDFVNRTKITFRDENNHELVWWASKEIDDVKEGEKIEFTGGSVKKHSRYNGVDQTNLTRVKFKSE